MKRYGNLWSRICDRENIEEAANNALKGKELTKERRFFIDNRERLLDELQQSLIDESYKFSFIWGKMRTAAREAAPQIALRDCSKAAVGEGQYIRFW